MSHGQDSLEGDDGLYRILITSLIGHNSYGCFYKQGVLSYFFDCWTCLTSLRFALSNFSCFPVPKHTFRRSCLVTFPRAGCHSPDRGGHRP